MLHRAGRIEAHLGFNVPIKVYALTFCPPGDVMQTELNALKDVDVVAAQPLAQGKGIF